MVKKIAILGSTGSIGRNSLRVIDALNASIVDSRQSLVDSERNRFEVFGLSAHRNAELLAKQARKYGAKVVAITDERYEKQLRGLLEGEEIEILSGAGSLEGLARIAEVDIVLSAVVGAAGLGAVLAAAKGGKRVAIANKEPLVIAGELLIKEAAANGAEIIPIDSEHSAVFQCLQAGRKEEVEQIILTGSGGPFRGMGPEQIEKVTLEQALSHPVWDMGPKITVDSATMMNKALEVIEARWLFGVEVEKIEVLIHPESIIHSMVEFVDGSVVGQLGRPDMCLPIQYALTYPERLAGIAEPIRLEEVGRLTFEEPNMETFAALRLGYEVAREGGTGPVVFNAANEAAVQEFLDGKIKFVNIGEVIEYCLEKHSFKKSLSLIELLEVDAWARREVDAWVKKKV